MVRGGERIRKPRCPDPEYEEIDFRTQKQDAAESTSVTTNCDLCGSNVATVRCDKCNNQAFCLACDDMYHRHPRRSTHVRKAVDRRPREGFVRPPLPPKGNEVLTSPPPQPPPRRNKRTAFLPSNVPAKSEQTLNTAVGERSDLRTGFRGRMENRPLPPTPVSRGLTKAESTGNLALFNNSLNHYAADPNKRLPPLTLPRAIHDLNHHLDNKISQSVPPTPPSAHTQYPSMLHPQPLHGQSPQPANLKGRKFSLQQQIPPSFDDKMASMVEAPSNGSSWSPREQFDNVPEKHNRSQSISDAQWNQMVSIQRKTDPSDAACLPSGAASDIGVPPHPSRGFNNRSGNSGRGMMSSASVSDLNAINHFHPQQFPGNIQPANSFQQMNMMRYDGNMMWMGACPMCQPHPSAYPGQTNAGMKRTASNLSMNMSSAASDVPPGYHPQWGHQHMHSHQMPMYPGYYHGFHPPIMPNMSSMHGSSMSIPDSPPASVMSSRISRKSSKSGSFRSSNANHRSRNRSNRRSEESDESGSFSGSEDDAGDEVFSKSFKQNATWQCDHCTFINPGHSQTCGMCSKNIGYSIREKSSSQRDTNRRKNGRDLGSEENIPNFGGGNKLRKGRSTRSLRSDSIKSSSAKRRNKSRVRSSSRSASPILSENDDRRILEKQLQDLRITPRSAHPDYEGVSISSRGKKHEKRGHYKREDSVSNRRLSTRASTPRKELLDDYLENRSGSSFSYHEDNVERRSHFHDSDESSGEPPPRTKSSRDTTDETLVPTLSSVLKQLEEDHFVNDDDFVRKETMQHKEDSPEEIEEDDLELPQFKFEEKIQDELGEEMSKKIEALITQTLRQNDDRPQTPKEPKIESDDPSFANTLDDVDTMATNEVADIEPNSRSINKVFEVDDRPKEEDVMDNLVEGSKEGSNGNQTEIKVSKEEFFEQVVFDNKTTKDEIERNEAEDKAVGRTSGCSYEQIDEPIQVHPTPSIVLKSEKPTDKTYESMSEKAGKEAVQDVNIPTKPDRTEVTKPAAPPVQRLSAERLDSRNKSPSLESFHGRPASTPDRQCTPISFSSSDAQFYSPPDSPELLVGGKLRERFNSEPQGLDSFTKSRVDDSDLDSSSETPSLDHDDPYQTAPFEDALATQDFPLTRSASDQAIFSRLQNKPSKEPSSALGYSKIKNSGFTEEVDERFLTVEELITRRKQKTMKQQGLELVQLLRKAEEQGYNPEEVSIALTLCGEKTPLDWLRDNWTHMVDTVRTLATNYGEERKDNDIGQVSEAEAVSALRLHKGNIWAAVTESVEERQKKFSEIYRRGNFKREDILKALKDNNGNSDDAYFQLNKTQQLGSFFKKIWSPATVVQDQKGDGDSNTNTQKDLSELDDDDEDETDHSDSERTPPPPNIITLHKPEVNSVFKEEKTSELESSLASPPKKTEDEVLYISKEDVVVHPLKAFGHYAVMNYADDERDSDGNETDLVTASKGEEPCHSKELKTKEKSEDQTVNVVVHQIKDNAIKTSSHPTTGGSLEEVTKLEQEQRQPTDDVIELKLPETAIESDEEEEETTQLAVSDDEYEDEEEEEFEDEDTEEEEQQQEQDESLSVTTGRLSLSFTQTSAQEANIDVKSQTIETQQMPSASKNENSVSDTKETPNQSIIETKELYKGSGPVTVQKATLIVGKAIAKAMARDTVDDEVEEHEAEKKDCSSEQESESEDDQGRTLDTITEEETKSPSRSQSGQSSGTSESSAVSKNTTGSRPPAVASFSGPIFIPSVSSSAIKQNWKVVENTSKTNTSSTFSKTFPKGPLAKSDSSQRSTNSADRQTKMETTRLQADVGVKDKSATLGNDKVKEECKNAIPPQNKTIQESKPTGSSNEKSGLKEVIETPKDVQVKKPTSPQETRKTGSTKQKQPLQESVNAQPSQNKTRFQKKQKRTTIDSSGESEEEDRMIDDLKSKERGVGKEDVENLKEQIKVLKQELGIQDGGGVAGSASVSKIPQIEVDEISDESQEESELEERDGEVSASKQQHTEEDEQLKFDRTVRRVLAEGQVREYEKAELVAHLLNLSFDECDSIAAAEECASIYGAVKFLRQDCEICAEKYSMAKMVSMLNCTHRCCYDCANNYFSYQIKAKNIRELGCPFCSEPDLDLCEEVAAEYLNNLDILLKGIIDEETHELFQRKLRDWTLMKEPNFQWCSKCSSGFISNPRARKLICPDCKNMTCAQCRKQWELQHEGITCEAFAKWQEENNDQTQAEGVAKHLAECGITCPKCKFTYSLAKGGCMHFTCTECKYEFCSGCGQAFKQGAKCPVGSYCERLGLHAHHPRNCLFYLRDKEPAQLQQLLKENEVSFDIDPSDKWDESTKKECRVQEQKETIDGLKDDLCGRVVLEGHAGLCRVHYIEYLVEKINTHGLDPVSIFDEADLRVCLRRNGKGVPPRRWESEKLYRDKLTQLIKKEMPLK